MKIIETTQGSTEWMLARAGLVTASEADSLVSPTWKAREGQGVETYFYRKLAERILGYIPEDVSGGGGTWAMQQGSILEKVALPWYEFRHGVEVRRVGFCATDDGQAGCSPDGLIGEDCGIEVKCPQAATHLQYLLGQKVPACYLAQVHFSMLVTGYPRWVFCSYHPHLPPLVVNVLRDEAIIAAMRAALDPFLERLNAAEARVRGMMNVPKSDHANANEFSR